MRPYKPWRCTALASAAATPLIPPPSFTARLFVNPYGVFVDGGPLTHSGVTGRKNAIDTFGEYSRLSESALSGKDPSRIDRVGAYAACHASKYVESFLSRTDYAGVERSKISANVRG
jgi:S-adenosylmethionine synthetase